MKIRHADGHLARKRSGEGGTASDWLGSPTKVPSFLRGGNEGGDVTIQEEEGGEKKWHNRGSGERLGGMKEINFMASSVVPDSKRGGCN